MLSRFARLPAPPVKDGVTRYGTEILADKVDFLSRGNGSSDENDNTDAPQID